MEQVRNQVNVRLIDDPNKLLKAVAKVSFRESEIINLRLGHGAGGSNQDHFKQTNCRGILDLRKMSKFIMYSFYYDHYKAKYADRCTLLFTDTDSLFCEVRSDDLYADMMDTLDL